MNRISRQLLKIAKEVNALDEEGDGSGFQMWHDHENAEQERLDLAQKEGKKYILHHKEGKLWRIQSCKDFGMSGHMIKKGDFGGLIESEKNLSQDGNCWVYDTAKVYGNAKVYENAIIDDNAAVSGNAKIHRGAWIGMNIHISGDTQVTVMVY